MGRKKRDRKWRAALLVAPVSLALTIALADAAPAGSAPPPATPTVSATDGVPVTAQVLDQVFGPCPNSPNATWEPEPSTVSINWGDGTAASGGTATGPNWATASPTGSAQPVTVSGTHTYVEPGTYDQSNSVGVTIDCYGPSSTSNPTIHGTFVAHVADAPPVGSPVSPAIALITGQPYDGTVATFTDNNVGAAAGTYTASIDWGDGTSTTTGTITGTDATGFTVSGDHTYAAGGSYPVSVTIKDGTSPADGGPQQTVVDETATVSNPPSSVAFTISPNTDPTLSRKTLTFAITSPTPGVTYQWDFGNTDSPTGSATAPFVVQATGDTVTYAYPDPPIPANEPTGKGDFPSGGASSRFAVYVVRVQAVIPGHPTLSATPQNLVVVPVQPPTAAFDVLRASAANGGTGEQTAVTAPVTIVPQPSLPGSDTSAPDQIVRIDYWFNLQGATPGTSPVGVGGPDLTCLSDGACGHYGGSALVPPDSALSALPGQQDLGTGPLSSNGTPAHVTCVFNAKDHGRSAHARRPRASPIGPGAHCNDATAVAPTGGFDSFSMNFWDNALGNIGSPTGLTTLPQMESPAPTLVAGYPPLASVNLADVDGNKGEQGLPPEGCFPGYPVGGKYAIDDNSPTGEDCVAAADGGAVGVEPGSQGLLFGPYDRAQNGINSTEQLEDQFNFLYNYATVVGTDTNLDQQFGPATGASEGSHGSTTPRTITMVAYNSEGVPSAPVTEDVPLTPATNPTLQTCVQDLTLKSACVNTSKASKTPFTITAGDTLNVDTAGSSGGTDPILYYAVEVGQPNKPSSITYCKVGKLGGYTWALTPANPAPTGPPTRPTGPGVKHPTAVDESGTSVRSDAEPVIGNPGGGISISRSRNPTQLTPWPMPAFSDLEAGAFPYHDCGSYAIRTVNGNGAPARLPSSGPNVPAHPAIARPHASGPGGGTTTTPIGPIYKQYPAPKQANPVLITSNPNGLDFTFAKAGVYSVAVAAYDSSGLGAITRIDGFQAEPSRTGGNCQNVNSAAINIPDPNLKHTPTETLGFSGTCMTVVSKKNSLGKSTPVLYASTTPIDVDGAPLNPSSGDSIVVDPASDEIYVTKCTIKQFNITGTFKNPCPNPSGGSAGAIYVGLGIGFDQKPAGIADVTNFNAAKANAVLGPLATGGLQSIDAKPAQGAAFVKDCGQYPGSGEWSKASGGPQYDGFDVATNVCVAFTTKQQSRIAFWDSLPNGFGDAARHQPSPTSQVVLQGQDVPAVSTLETNQYANVARAGKRPRRIIAGSPASFAQMRMAPIRARVADSGNLPGFPSIPSCPPSSNGKSGLSIPDGTDMGPISIPAGVEFCLDPKTGDFIGNLKVNIPGPLPINGVEVGFEIGHGRLIDAGGDVSGNIPIFPAVFINDFKFDVQTDPTEVAAEITASIADVLDVEGGLLIKPQTPEVDFEGSVSIFGFQFGNFAIDYVKDTVGFHVTIGKSFGPASINITVSGAMAWSPQFAFYMEGQGSACLFICIGVEGLVSNEGLAACGSINLLFVTLSAGFAVIWSGPESGVHLFTGCDLTPYIPAELRNVKGTVADRASPDGRASPNWNAHGASGPQPTIAAGGSEQLVLYRKGDCTPKITTHCHKVAAAVQVHSLLSDEATGETPIVTLTGPGGRVIQTPALPGYYGFQSSATMSGGSAGGQTDDGTALVDQNPVPVGDTNQMSTAYCPGASATALPPGCPEVTTTTLFVADPEKGLWTLSVGAGSPPVVDTAISFSQPPPKKSSFNAAVHTATLKATSTGWNLGIAGKQYSSSLLSSGRLVLSQSVVLPPVHGGLIHFHKIGAGDIDVPPIDVSRLRAILLKVPSGFQGTVTVMDDGPSVDQVIASGISSNQIPSGGLPITFEPTPDFGGMHHIVAFLVNSDGMPDRTITLTSFKSPSLAAPKAPKIVKIVRTGSSVQVYFDPGNAPIADGIGLALATSGGEQFDGRFSGSQLHAIGKPVGIGAAKQAREYMITIPNVDPTQDINVGLDGINDGQLGGTSSHFMRPVVKSVPESRLIGAHGGAKVLF